MGAPAGHTWAALHTRSVCGQQPEEQVPSARTEAIEKVATAPIQARVFGAGPRWRHGCDVDACAAQGGEGEG